MDRSWVLNVRIKKELSESRFVRTSINRISQSSRVSQQDEEMVITTAFEVGVRLLSATLSTGMRTLVSGKISCSTTSWHIIRNCKKTVGLSFLAVEVAGDVHRLFVTYSAIQHIVPIKKDNTALIENTSIAIMQTIDGSIELIVTSKGLEESTGSFSRCRGSNSAVTNGARPPSTSKVLCLTALGR